MPEAADRLGVSIYTVRRWIKDGKIRAFRPGKEYRIQEADLEEFLRAREVRPKAPSRLPFEPSLNDALEEERLSGWEAAAEEARRLREPGWAQMWEALSGWRASKQRGEPYAARRKYLDEMGNLLEEVSGVETALGWAYVEAAITQGGSDASFPRYLREESRAISHFYGELLGLVKSAKLSVRVGADAAAAKRGAEAQPEARPHIVEEIDDAA